MDRNPIAIFAYNRVDALARMLDSLVACRGFGETQVIVFVDGPRNDSDREAVGRVAAYLESRALPNFEVRISAANRGLRASIAAGVTDVCNRFGSVIVLEDDLVLSPSALEFFNEGLSRYADDPRIWSICGYVYDSTSLRDRSRALVLPYTHPWGWATWKRSWDRFSLSNAPARENLHSSAFRTAFDGLGMYPFTALLKQSLKGRVNSWFVHWYFTVFQHGGRSIFPSHRVVDNYGISGGGTHSGFLNPYDLLVTRPPLFTEPVDFAAANPGMIDYWAMDLMAAGRELAVQRSIARLGGLKRSTLSWLSRS